MVDRKDTEGRGAGWGLDGTGRDVKDRDWGVKRLRYMEREGVRNRG